MSEWAAIDELRACLEAGNWGDDSESLRTRTRVRVGIGDDAAVLSSGRSNLVWTVDAALEHVHFERNFLSLRDLGFKATQAAVSDIAAMGARPVAALCHLALPRGTRRSEVASIGRGQADASAVLSCPVVGGNISSGPALELVTTVLGEVVSVRGAGSEPLGRSGARPGDELWLLGELGLARAGLLALQSGLGAHGAVGHCIQAWRRPSARVDAGLTLRGRATACLDVSDGLAGDARHLAKASGVRVVVASTLLEEALSSNLVRASSRLGESPLELALRGGEDYALLATGPAKRRPAAARVIGRVTPGAGVFLEGSDGLVHLSGGFEHLF